MLQYLPFGPGAVIQMMVVRHQIVV